MNYLNKKSKENLFKLGCYKFFNLVFNIHPDEFWLVQLFLALFVAISMGYVVTSTAVITLFLTKTSPLKLHVLLPWILIGNAAAISFVGYFYKKLIDKTTRLRLFNYVSSFFMFSFLLLRYLVSLSGNHPAIYFFLMLWDETCSVILIMMFYTYMGDFFHIYHAKRLYAYITGGVALGTPLAGFGSAYFLHYFSAANLLYISVLFLALANLIAYLILKLFSDHRINVEEVNKGGVDLEVYKNEKNFSLVKLFSNKYLALLLLIGGLAVFCSSISAYQFFYISAVSLDEKVLGTFMGEFYGYVGLALLILDFILGRWILRYCGIVGSLLILPILLIFSSAGFYFYPILLFAAMIKFIDSSLFQTVNAFSLQSLYLPLPEKLRIHGLSASAGVMEAGARLLAGLVLILLSFFVIPVRFYALIIILVSIVSLLIILNLGSIYRKIIQRPSELS